MFTDKDKKGKKKKETKRKPFSHDLFDDVSKLKHDSGETEMVIPGEIIKPDEGNDSEKYVKKEKFSLGMFLAYALSPIGAFIYLRRNDGMREQFHGKQALYLGVVNFILIFVLVGILTWIYTIYIGFKSAKGEDPEIPYITKKVRGN